eukprot:869203-Rhodomonas_salina.1
MAVPRIQERGQTRWQSSVPAHVEIPYKERSSTSAENQSPGIAQGGANDRGMEEQRGQQLCHTLGAAPP